MLISNLAALYALKKEFTESINCYRKALLICKDQGGNKEISTAHILLNLARVYKEVNRHNDSEFYLRQAEVNMNILERDYLSNQKFRKYAGRTKS
jgi:hypothetical protein